MNPKKKDKKIFKGSVTTMRFAVVVSRFHDHITAKLLEGVEHCLHDHGVPEENRKVFSVQELLSYRKLPIS